jgi:hypothetical protein
LPQGCSVELFLALSLEYEAAPIVRHFVDWDANFLQQARSLPLPALGKPTCTASQPPSHPPLPKCLRPEEVQSARQAASIESK